MAEIHQANTAVSGRRRSKKISTKIDFTPMVDLAFLLITFFMLTTTLSGMRVIKITMPEDGSPSPVSDSVVLTLILSSDNRIYYYTGFPDSGIHETNFSSGGVRKLLLEKNAPQMRKINSIRNLYESGQITYEEFSQRTGAVKSDKRALVVLIKSDAHSKYKNLIELLDEIHITGVSKYAILDISQDELDLISTFK